MDFDWSSLPFDGKEAPSMREIEEAFEDPHSLRLFPDAPRFAVESRAFCLGKTLNGRGIFSVFRADGKKITAMDGLKAILTLLRFRFSS